MDDLVAGFFRGLGWFFGELVVELIYRLGYWMGWPLMKCLTLGRYPRSRRGYSRRRHAPEGAVWTFCLGLSVTLFITVYLFSCA